MNWCQWIMLVVAVACFWLASLGMAYNAGTWRNRGR